MRYTTILLRVRWLAHTDTPPPAATPEPPYPITRNLDTAKTGTINPPRIRAGKRRVGACPVAVCANRLRSHGLSAGPEPNAMCRDDEVNGARKLGASSDFAP